jgi:hypothetical protein
MNPNLETKSSGSSGLRAFSALPTLDKSSARKLAVLVRRKGRIVFVECEEIPGIALTLLEGEDIREHFNRAIVAMFSDASVKARVLMNCEIAERNPAVLLLGE